MSKIPFLCFFYIYLLSCFILCLWHQVTKTFILVVVYYIVYTYIKFHSKGLT